MLLAIDMIMKPDQTQKQRKDPANASFLNGPWSSDPGISSPMFVIAGNNTLLLR